jgi:hypothetical protein
VVAATQTSAQRLVQPTIENGLPVTTYAAADFVTLTPPTTLWTLYRQSANAVTGSVNAAATLSLQGALANFDADVGAWLYAQHISTVHMMWQHGGVCGRVLQVVSIKTRFEGAYGFSISALETQIR